MGRKEIVKSKYPDVADTAFTIDPSSNFKYSNWIAKQLSSGFPEQDIKLSVLEFDKNCGRIKTDINSFTSLNDLKQAVNSIGKSNRSRIKQDKIEGAEVIFDDGTIKVVRLEEYSAAKYYCSGTKWCISDEETFYNYLFDDKQIYVIIGNGRKFAKIADTDSFFNEKDDEFIYNSSIQLFSLLGFDFENLIKKINHDHCTHKNKYIKAQNNKKAMDKLCLENKYYFNVIDENVGISKLSLNVIFKNIDQLHCSSLIQLLTDNSDLYAKVVEKNKKWFVEKMVEEIPGDDIWFSKLLMLSYSVLPKEFWHNLPFSNNYAKRKFLKALNDVSKPYGFDKFNDADYYECKTYILVANSKNNSKNLKNIVISMIENNSLSTTFISNFVFKTKCFSEFESYYYSLGSRGKTRANIILMKLCSLACIRLDDSIIDTKKLFSQLKTKKCNHTTKKT